MNGLILKKSFKSPVFIPEDMGNIIEILDTFVMYTGQRLHITKYLKKSYIFPPLNIFQKLSGLSKIFVTLIYYQSYTLKSCFQNLQVLPVSASLSIRVISELALSRHLTVSINNTCYSVQQARTR